MLTTDDSTTIVTYQSTTWDFTTEGATTTDGAITTDRTTLGALSTTAASTTDESTSMQQSTTLEPLSTTDESTTTASTIDDATSTQQSTTSELLMTTDESTTKEEATTLKVSTTTRPPSTTTLPSSTTTRQPSTTTLPPSTTTQPAVTTDQPTTTMTPITSSPSTTQPTILYNLTLTNKNSTSLTISWTIFVEVAALQVQWRPLSAGSNFESSGAVFATLPEYKLTGLMAATTYEIRLALPRNGVLETGDSVFDTTCPEGFTNLLCSEGKTMFTRDEINSLHAVDTIGNCQRLAFTVGVSQHKHKITNL